jgi:hypothetical protein
MMGAAFLLSGKLAYMGIQHTKQILNGLEILFMNYTTPELILLNNDFYKNNKNNKNN